MYYCGNDKLSKIIEDNKTQIADETLSDKIEERENDGTELDINGEKLKVKLVVTK